MQIAGQFVPARLAAGVLVYLLAGTALLVVVWPGSRATRADAPLRSPAVAAALRFPAPPPGAVVYARRLGSNVLAAGFVRRDGKVLVRVSVVGPQGDGVQGLDIRVAGAAASACGRGCYERETPLMSVVPIQALGATWRVEPKLSAAPAAAIVERATSTWRGLRSLSWRETLASGPKDIARSTWSAEAPASISYDVAGGGSSVVIGARRWDRTAKGTWARSTQDPVLRQPVPFWQAAQNAHVLSDSTARGKHVWVVSFFDPKTPGWYRLTVEKGTYRTFSMDMYAASHFMHDTYGAFGKARVTAPSR